MTYDVEEENIVSKYTDWLDGKYGKGGNYSIEEMSGKGGEES